jgi:opacity protein-like surface antigen
MDLPITRFDDWSHVFREQFTGRRLRFIWEGRRYEVQFPPWLISNGGAALNKRLFLLTLSLLSLRAEAQSEDAIGKFEITPYGAFSFGGSFNDEASSASARLEDSGSFGLILNYRESFQTQWEVIYSRQATTADFRDTSTANVEIDLDVHYLQIGGTYQGEGEKVKPYLAATIGAAHYDVKGGDNNSDTFLSFSLGPGLQVRPNDRLGLRLEARLFGTFVQSGSRLFCVSDPGNGMAGCAISISGEILWQTQLMAGVVFRF